MSFNTRITAQVFGISNTVLPDSYVDRGALDEQIQILLGRPTHIALRGESKCGKSWLR
jgi:stage III sporulation protein SpoIIIAA